MGMDLLKRAGFSVLGLVLVLSWWSFRGWACDRDDSTQLKAMPAAVFDGTTAVDFDIDVTGGPAYIRATFSRQKPGYEDTERVHVHEETVPAGKKRYTVRVPKSCDGYMELGSTTVGTTVLLTVSILGKETFREQDTLNEPLKPNYAFAVQWETDEGILEDAAER